MAITVTALYEKTDIAGFTNPADPGLSSGAATFRTTIPIAVTGNEDADATVGVQNVLDAVETYGAGALATALKLDSAATVTMAIYVKDVVREPDGATIFNTGVEYYNCDALIKWE